MIYYHTMEIKMPKAKIAVTINEEIVLQIDQLVKQHEYTNRSQAIEDALMEKLKKINKYRLSKELTKLDIQEERHLAEEGIEGDNKEWAQY
jgi:Arc/MetJ-type ribon-helix-helix transcriptional regulator